MERAEQFGKIGADIEERVPTFMAGVMVGIVAHEINKNNDKKKLS